MKVLTIFLLFISGSLMAQKNIAHFSFWKPKPGMEKDFENGYKKHLEWHKANNDPWEWYGWYVISGPRDGWFVDATLNHAWADFDQSVKPADDNADNQLHTYPYGDFQKGCKLLQIPSLSIANGNSLKTKLLRLVTLSVTNTGAAKQVLAKLKGIYQQKQAGDFLTFQLVDGGDLNQFVILIGLNSFADYGKVDHIQDDLDTIQTSLKIKAVSLLSSETLLYKADMSLLKNK
jgi:hypothetical protein